MVVDPQGEDAVLPAMPRGDSPVYPPSDVVRAAVSNDHRGCHAAAPSALVVAVTPESPADDAGFEPGCQVVSIDGQSIRDIIDWRWLSADDAMTLGYIDLDGEEGEVELERNEGEDWGFSFEGVVFDGIKQCRNACTFCFMRQLPDDLRPSLTLRDDDFRLSFLSGTFVTLTNVSLEDEQRIIEQRITPLRVSLHAADPEARRALIGRHSQHGIDVLDRLLAAGIEVHAQIVLVPGANDGSILEHTLAWAYERPNIVNIGIVPLGFTKHQTTFDRSFNDPVSARAVLEAVEPLQRCALAERGTPWVFAADEFYRNAYGNELLTYLPPTSHYGDFEMFEDGIGIIRSHVDDWEMAKTDGLVERCATVLVGVQIQVYFLAGFAMREYFSVLLARGPLAKLVMPLYVKNTFFGGNVDVTGLLAGEDIACAITSVSNSVGGGALKLFVVPNVIFNDNGVTLDDMSLEDIGKAAGAPVAVVSCNSSSFLEEIIALAHQARA